MKRLLVAALILAGSFAAFGQGQLIFINNAATAITNGVTGLPAAGGPAQDDTQVGLYVGHVGDSVSSLTLIGNVTNCFAPGRFLGSTRTLAGWVGEVQLQVRAWLATTVYPSYEAAMAAALGGDGSVLVGVSDPFLFLLDLPPGVPVPIANNGLTPIVLLPAVPEPSSLALGLLGLGLLAMTCLRSRPRKNFKP